MSEDHQNDNQANEASDNLEKTVDVSENKESSSKPSKENEKAPYSDVIAAVKKDSRKKGFEEGRQAALKELQNIGSSYDSEEPKNENIQQQNYNYHNQNGQYLDPEQQQWMTLAAIADKEGSKKYDDYHEKLEWAVKKAEKNPAFRELMTHAYKTADGELIYKICTDKNVRANLMDADADNRMAEFKKVMKPAPSVKTPAPPIDEIKSTPSTGTTKLTAQQKCARSRKLYR